MNAVTSEETIDVTPDPQILQILSYLEMRPIDALCELIDNSIDATREAGNSVIQIDLPTRRDLEDGQGRIRVHDNGPGMTSDQLRNSLRAGYSSKQRTGSLGLFGVGFNIATGKLGRVTEVITARSEDEFATRVELDLVSLRRSGHFKMIASKIPKPAGLSHGTVVEVSQPWGSGNQNYGFLAKLVAIGKPKALLQVGRIYGSLLREGKIAITLSAEPARAFEHCVWGDQRYVEHARHGKLPAIFRFKNRVVHTSLVCAACGADFSETEAKCSDSTCGSSSSKSIAERISGWLGIQRYQDTSHFGIDLIRNGRAIRVLEKQAFFEFQDPDSGAIINDYPIDNAEGRIVGEIHLDHVPVDPAKQNFERSSPEWRRALEFLRGNSSLQPERPNADTNDSPIFKLYQGYRKVRGPGRRSMYMGKWLPGDDRAKLLSKSEIEEFLVRFKKREPGFFDDSEWWKLVEQADTKPISGLVQCPSCFLESPQGMEECSGCGHIFLGKACVAIGCGKTIVQSAVVCPHCGVSQIPEVETPWGCAVCGSSNQAQDLKCNVCGFPAGSVDPVSRDGLLAVSHPAPELSISSLTIPLAIGNSAPIDVSSFVIGSEIRKYRSDGSSARLPCVRFIGEGIEVFLDPAHPLFEKAGMSLEEAVSVEAASYLLSYYQSQYSKSSAEHSITKLTTEVLGRRWPSLLSASDVGDELTSLFDGIRQRLADSAAKDSEEMWVNVSQEERTAIATELVRKGRDVSELAAIRSTGEFILYLRPRSIVDVFKTNPQVFFDGSVWNITYASIPALHPEGGATLQAQIKNEYSSLLDIAALYAEKRPETPREISLVKAVCRVLSSRIVDSA